MSTDCVPKMTLIGFGEVAATLFARGLSGLPTSIYIPLGREPSNATKTRLAESGCEVSSSPKVVSEASVIVSAVTPSAALTAAQDVSPYLTPGVLYVDMNSVSGQLMEQIGACVEERGAQCVDAAIMGPVPVYRNRVPIFLSGSASEPFLRIAQSMGLSDITVISARLGDASSLKMLWSVITKGTIALLAESLIAAHRVGLLAHLKSLLAQEYGNTGSDRMILRMLGSSAGGAARRLDEMAQVRMTLESAHVPTWSTSATGRWIGMLSQMPVPRDYGDVEGLVDHISAALNIQGVQAPP